MTTGVLLEIANPGCTQFATAAEVIRDWPLAGFKLDPDYQPVVMQAGPKESAGTCTVIIHGWIDSETTFEQLRARTEVVEAWLDTPIAPMPKREK